MIKKTTTALLGAGMLVVGLAGPTAASADASDNALAFVIGAAVGHAIDDNHSHLRRAHRPAVVPVHRGPAYYHGRGKHYGWYRWQRPGWKHHGYKHRDYHRFDRHDRRYDRRHDRRHDRRGDRDWRGHDRDDRRDRRHH